MGVRFSSTPTDKVHGIKASSDPLGTQSEDIDSLPEEKDMSTQTEESDSIIKEKESSKEEEEKEEEKEKDKDKEPILFSTQKTDNQTILLNQAYCHTCHTVVKWCGTCTCGNVEVFGGDDELGRKIKHPNLFSDCNLIEYKGHSATLPNTPTNDTQETNSSHVIQEQEQEQEVSTPVPKRKQSKKKYNTRYQSKV